MNGERTCSANFCDNLLVETDIFIILGVSFCVTRNDFSLIKIKKKNIGAQFRKYYIPQCHSFFKLMELLVPFATHNCFYHCGGSIVIFNGCCIRIKFHTNYIVYQSLQFGKKSGAQFFIINIHVRGCLL